MKALLALLLLVSIAVDFTFAQKRPGRWTKPPGNSIILCFSKTQSSLASSSNKTKHSITSLATKISLPSYLGGWTKPPGGWTRPPGKQCPSL